ncbi:expressed unknown protein [Ectocarpus siliculosus]|uniref:Oxidoreductase-like domain-containing protein n=1 Tax=Ectocarpus siliculosus TaxID=2880 RepID=D7FV34_ECTSI|nr:expressed unknown protein [Ectocarpus siliculosus]|eukprot:CBJ31840.1 expressed unknown protein [Ectocarpus siliculosus]
MSFASVLFGPCKRHLATRTCCVARRASASSLCPLADGRREEPRSSRARASGPAEQGLGAVQCRRRYHHWSPPGATDTNSNSGTSLNMAVDKEQQQQQRHQEQPQQQAQTKPALPPKSPQAVAMEEFADLERKLASPREAPRRKTPEQLMMEEFAALERKLGSTQQASAGGAQPVGQSSRLRNTLTKPEEPEAEECCGNGCATCVWIGYWEELQAWEEAGREREEAPP